MPLVIVCTREIWEPKLIMHRDEEMFLTASLFTGIFLVNTFTSPIFAVGFADLFALYMHVLWLSYAIHTYNVHYLYV